MDEPPHQPMTWLAQTKVQPPHLRDDVISRGRLLAALHDATRSHPLTLISAPAGYSKTTLLAALPHAFPDPPLAWLALDEEDNDLSRFLTALVVALQGLNPAFGKTTQTLLSNLTNPGAGARRVIGVLINDMLETLPHPFVLGMEDLHLVTEPSVYAALDYLLERLAPQMHLVVTARHDPPLTLARRRAGGQLAELRLPDLRFTHEETCQFLNEKLHLGLSPDDLSAPSPDRGMAGGLAPAGRLARPHQLGRRAQRIST